MREPEVVRTPETSRLSFIATGTPASGSVRNKPRERALTRACVTDAGSFFPLAASGAVYLLTAPRHLPAPGHRFAVRATILNDDGLKGSPLMADLVRGG